MENLEPNEVLKNLKKKKDLKEKWRKVNHARYTMHVISALCILSVIFLWSQEEEMFQNVVYYIMLIAAGIYIGLSIWAKFNPKLALITAILVFLFPIIVNALEDIESIYEGYWWKILILGLFIRGLLSVKHMPREGSNDELLDDF